MNIPILHWIAMVALAQAASAVTMSASTVGILCVQKCPNGSKKNNAKGTTQRKNSLRLGKQLSAMLV